jgi:hypothetical protein
MLLSLLLLALTWAGPSGAANGDNLRQIIADRTGTNCASYNAAGDHPSVGVGIAFDGTNLLLSCYSDNTVTAVSPADGSQVAVHHIIGASSLGALAWDNGRHLLWACSGFSTVGTIDLTTNLFVPLFLSNGCFDGTAYDGSDDTLWTSPDARNDITHYTTTGVQLGRFFPSLPCGNSGIAVGGSLLYLATDGCQSIYTSAKDFSAAPDFFASFPRRLEDLECDDLTFAVQLKGAIWSTDAYDNILNAWEIPFGSCRFGGGGGPGPPATLTLTPPAATNPVDTQHCVTATVEDAAGNPVPNVTVRFSVTGSVTTGGSDTTDANGEATFCYTGPTSPGADAIHAYADNDNSGTQDVGEPFGDATKAWVPAAPDTLVLDPPAAMNNVGDKHCVTATVRDVFQNPVPNVDVYFTVMGFNPQPTTKVTTDANGEAEFCYVGTVVGMDTIDAFADSDGNGMQDLGEPFGRAIKIWKPARPACTSGFSSISSNFNGTAIPVGRTIWFNAVLKASGLPATGAATIHLTNSQITFSDPATMISYVLMVPDANITFSSANATASTTFAGMFVTQVPLPFGQNVFLDGKIFLSPGLSGGIKPVTWSGLFATDTPGVTLQWKWGAAVYTMFPTDPNYNAVGIKPVDGSAQNPYANSDHAGTPENFKPYVVGGARGGGGSNYTGSYSGTKSVPAPCPL